jgi:DHA1 family multidrug resistance protein-like MFS transporter
MPTYAVLLIRNTAWAITLNGPVMPLYVRSLGVDIVYWGVLATAISAGLFMEVVWGTVLDRVNRRLLILSALIGTSLLYPLYTIKALLPLFIVLQFVFGAVNVMIGLTTRAVIAEDLPTDSSGFYMSLWFFFATLGAIIGPILGTYIASTYGYEYSFYSSSALVLAAAVFYGFFYIHGSQPVMVITRNQTSLLTGVKRLLGVGYLPKIYLITMFAILGSSCIGSFLPIYATERIGMATIAVGGMMTTAALGRLVATPLIGRFSDRVDKRKLLAAILGAASIFLALFLTVKDSTQLTFVTFGVSLCFSSGVLSIAIHSAAAPKELSGMALGLYGTFEDLGLMVGSTVFGLSWAVFGPQSIFIIASGATLTAALLALSLGHGKQ